MDRSLRWRTFVLVGIVLLCGAILAPSLVSRSSLPGWFPFQKQISLGLDLRGGLHIVYSIDLEQAVEDRASEIRRDLEGRLAEQHIAATVKTPLAPHGAITLTVADPARRDEVERAIRTDYQVDWIACATADPPGALCMKVASDYAESIKRTALTNARMTILERIDGNGVTEPTVVEKDDQIIVELPGLDKEVIEQTKDLIARTAKLEFKVVDDGSPYMTKLYRHVAADPRAASDGVRGDLDVWPRPDGGPPRRDPFLYADDREESVPEVEAKAIGCIKKSDRDPKPVVNGRVTCEVTGKRVLERYVRALAGDLAVPESHQIGYELADARAGRWRTYYLDRAVHLTGTAIKNAAPSYDPNTRRPVVLIEFTRAGSKTFGELTARIVGKKLATILDGKVKSAPVIHEAIRGTATITMGGGAEDGLRQERERDELVTVLKTGSLPAPLREESSAELGPTLGQDAIDKTKVAFAAGILLVVIIMVGVYRWSGWISVFAVVWHLLMTFAVMALFGATLTLPGIAAIVLSIGMEVDGNILIYERIRDELNAGKSVRGAIDLGFSRAFSAILDGQLTTAAAAWVLLNYGSGPIKGFAVMLLVGVFTTLTTNVWITRIFFDWSLAVKARKKGHQLATLSI